MLKLSLARTLVRLSNEFWPVIISWGFARLSLDDSASNTLGPMALPEAPRGRALPGSHAHQEHHNTSAAIAEHLLDTVPLIPKALWHSLRHHGEGINYLGPPEGSCWCHVPHGLAVGTLLLLSFSSSFAAVSGTSGTQHTGAFMSPHKNTFPAVFYGLINWLSYSVQYIYRFLPSNCCQQTTIIFFCVCVEIIFRGSYLSGESVI